MSRKAHPTLEGISADTEGNIYRNNIICTLWERNRSDRASSMSVTIDRFCYTAARVILECHTASPTIGRRIASYNDGDHRNLKMSNLTWKSDQISKRKRISVANSMSVLSRAETIKAYKEYKDGSISIAALARRHNTSSTTIRRAFDRAKKMIG